MAKVKACNFRDEMQKTQRLPSWVYSPLTSYISYVLHLFLWGKPWHKHPKERSERQEIEETEFSCNSHMAGEGEGCLEGEPPALVKPSETQFPIDSLNSTS